MDEILKLIRQLTGVGSSDAKRLKSIMGLNDAILTDSIEDLTDEDDGMKAISAADVGAKLAVMGYDIVYPGQTPAKKGAKSLPYSQRSVEDELDEEEEADDDEDPTGMKSVYMARYTEKSAAQKAILEGSIGKNYGQIMFDQEVAFAKALRVKETLLTTSELKSLNTQIFPPEALYRAVTEEGMTVAGMKATQVEAQGELGGFAVPAQRQAEYSKRLPGLTAIRGSGAKVIQLLNSNSTEIPVWRGNGNNYVGLLRQVWAGEAADPTAQNFKLDMVQVAVNLMTFKVPFSQSLVEDAANLTSMLMNDIVTTSAIGEDYAFQNGDGVGKPEGILPGNANTNSLSEVVSGSAAALTVAGIKKLKRGVPSQYRALAKWLANNDTYGIIEAFTAGAGSENWAFPDLSEKETLLSKAALESEGMADVAANAYPLLFGNFAGYTILERLGMTIMRFQDSGTGVNKVEYHVRKRVGGVLVEPWQMAVQKVSV